VEVLLGWSSPSAGSTMVCDWTGPSMLAAIASTLFTSASCI
jgi:hypothetical protein